MKISNLSMKTRTTKLLALLLTLALMAAALAACGSGGSGEPVTEDAGGNDANTGNLTITDHLDREVTLPAEINRIAVCDIFPIVKIHRLKEIRISALKIILVCCDQFFP